MQYTQSTGSSSSSEFLDEARNRFEAGRRNGGRPSLEEVVRSVPESFRSEVFRHLLSLEIEYRAQTQCPLALVEAQNRFRLLGPWAEAIARQLLGETISCDGYPSDTRAEDAAPPPERIGQYELLTELGSGGFGKVFKARHTQLKRLVALKVLIPHRVLTPGGIERFLREMEVHGRLCHPHIVRATDAGKDQGYYYLAMELVPGVDLGYLLKKLCRLPIPEACEIVRQAVEAVAFLGEHGTVHRDLKPNNLLIGQDGVLRVLDLGLAQLSDVPPWEQLTETGAVMGTPEYMSPEQIRESRELTIRADVYSLGCTLFALLTGRPPFVRGGSIYGLFRAHNETPPPAIRTVRAEVPAELERLILQMLEKEPLRRPSPEEIVRALGPFSEGADVKRLVAECGPRPETPVRLSAADARFLFGDPPGSKSALASTRVVPREPEPTTPRWTRRLALAVIAFALLLGGVAWAAWPRRSEEPGLPIASGPSSIAQRTFKLGEWTEMLDRSPVKKIWPPEGAGSRFVYEERPHRELFVNCTQLGALELGTVEAEEYEVEAEISQNGWTVGEVGVFLRGRAPSEPASINSWQAEMLFLGRLSSSEVEGAQAGLALRELGVLADGGGTNDMPLRWFRVPRPISPKQTLSFVVGPTRVTDIAWWGERESPRNLAIPVGGPVELGRASGGSLGVVVTHSSATFYSVRVRPLKLKETRP